MVSVTILVDANLLVYARVSSLPQNTSAHAWLSDRLNGEEPVGMAWESLLSFVRVTTNRRIFPRPLASEEAWGHVREWISLPRVTIPVPGERYTSILGRLILETSATADLIPDAHLAALAIEHGLVLCSSDGDFGRFRGLRWENPLLQ